MPGVRVCGESWRRPLHGLTPWTRWQPQETARRSWCIRRVARRSADVAEFFKISPASDIKCVAYMALKRGAGAESAKDTWHGVATFLRGDHQVNETKLAGSDRRRGAAHHAGRGADAVLQRAGGISGAGGIEARRQTAWRWADGNRGQVSRRPEKPGGRREQAGLSPAQRDAGARLYLDPEGRHSQRE